MYTVHAGQLCRIYGIENGFDFAPCDWKDIRQKGRDSSTNILIKREFFLFGYLHYRYR